MLLEVFSQEYGRIGLVAKGAVNKKVLNRNLQAFIPLEMAWSGKGELGSLNNAEPEGAPILLVGDRLFIGYYMNELLIRLLHRHDPHPMLFDFYREAIGQMPKSNCLESILRVFEKKLLEELGYGLILDHDVDSGKNVQPDLSYDYISGMGPVLISSEKVKVSGAKISGETLLLLLSDTPLEKKESRVEAKRLMRYALAPLLGDKPLKTRKIFETMKLNEVVPHESNEIDATQKP